MTERDQMDGAALVAVFGATQVPSSSKASDLRLVRRIAFKAIWDMPRRSGDLPQDVPWSKAARAAFDGRTGRGLVIEHIVPINLITDALVRGEQTVDAYLATLRSMYHLAVITSVEDKALTSAGYRHKHPDLTDPWSRYRAAGLHPDQFERHSSGSG